MVTATKTGRWVVPAFRVEAMLKGHLARYLLPSWIRTEPLGQKADLFYRNGPKSLERVKGIEPSSSAWKAVALPLSYTRIRTTEGWWGR